MARMPGLPLLRQAGMAIYGFVSSLRLLGISEPTGIAHVNSPVQRQVKADRPKAKAPPCRQQFGGNEVTQGKKP
jgi:hypothetical protein